MPLPPPLLPLPARTEYLVAAGGGASARVFRAETGETPSRWRARS